MSWLYERFSVMSDTGEIVTATREFGQWTVRFPRAIQTSAYTNAMWADAFYKVNDMQSPEVLILGLGGGGAVKELHQKFHDCRLTAVERDSAMLQIARCLSLWSPYPAPECVHADAKEFLSRT